MEAEKKLQPMSRLVTDLLDQRAELRDEIWQMEQEPKRKKEEKKRLETSGVGLDLASGLVVPVGVPGQPPKGASTEPRASKKMGRHMAKRHPGLPPDDRQEYYKSQFNGISPVMLALVWFYQL